MTDSTIERMVVDLRAFSAELLQGPQEEHLSLAFTRGRRGVEDGARANAAGIVRCVRVALREQDFAFVDSDQELCSVVVPRRASMCTRPRDWQQRDGDWLPTRWEVPAPCLLVRSDDMRWLIYALELALSFFSARCQRVSEWVGDAVAACGVGSSEWARKAEVQLRAVLEQASEDVVDAQRMLDRVRNLLGRPQQGRAAPPNPFPLTPGWGELRQHVVNLEQPRRCLHETAVSSLRTPIVISDVPILYQRWVGVKLLEAFEKCGWRIESDPVGALWLGGKIGLRSAGRSAELRVEYRFPRSDSDALRCTFGEGLTPDFCILFRTTRGPGAWILDATLSGGSDIVAEKQQKYLLGLQHTQPRIVAGQPVFAPPMRSWVASPQGSGHVHVADAEGRRGTLSADPASANFRGMVNWVSDLDEFATPT